MRATYVMQKTQLLQWQSSHLVYESSRAYIPPISTTCALHKLAYWPNEMINTHCLLFLMISLHLKIIDYAIVIMH